MRLVGQRVRPPSPRPSPPARGGSRRQFQLEATLGGRIAAFERKSRGSASETISRLISGFYIRPHPGPLPQEREEHSPRSWNTMPVGGPTVFEQRRNHATSANKAFELSDASGDLPLSPGERAGVRASASVISLGPHHTRPRVVWQGMRRSLLQCIEYGIADCLWLAPQLRVPETQFLDSKRLEEPGSFCVIGSSSRMSVLETVEFNREPGFFAEKVEEVFSGRMLAAEFVTTESTVSQPAPNQLLGPGGPFAQGAGEASACHGAERRTARGEFKNGVGARPHPSPLPRERENRWPRYGGADAQGYWVASSANDQPAAMTQTALGPSRDPNRARPLPGPLPREREEHWQRSWKTMSVGGPSVFEQRRNNDTSATEAFELSRAVRNFSLSPGERAGVRANVLFLLTFLFLAFAHMASAHEVRPAYLELRQTGPETYAALWKVPGLGENLRLGLYVELPAGCTNITAPHASMINNAYTERWSFRCEGGLTGRTIHITGLSSISTDVLVQIERLDGTTQVTRLTPSAPSFVVEAAPRALEVARTYSVLGVEHILTGIDHLLFILALLMITGGGWKLVKTVTAFTISHSITLTLATLGYIHVPQKPVEATIALSIVFVAAEILRGQHGRVGITARAPWLVAFSFGLMHGLGFASGLSEAGLPAGHIPTALLFFSIGVETGHFLFIGVVLSLMAVGRQMLLRLGSSSIYRPPSIIRLLPPYAIGTVAMFWVIQRVAAF